MKKKDLPKFIQLAIDSNPESDNFIYVIDENGDVWMLSERDCKWVRLTTERREE